MRVYLGITRVKTLFIHPRTFFQFNQNTAQLLSLDPYLEILENSSNIISKFQFLGHDSAQYLENWSKPITKDG